MEQKKINKAAGVLALISSAMGIYYLSKRNQVNVQLSEVNNPGTDPGATGSTGSNSITSLIGRTVVAKQNDTVVYKAKDAGGHWETTETVRLNSKKDEEIGTVIAIVTDGYTNETYAVIDIPFYIGSAFSTGHGFINTNLIKPIQ